jgi:hypothetical protein
MQCDGKERFGSFELARRVAHRMAQRKKDRISAYHCPHCGEFHVGSANHRRKKS